MEEIIETKYGREWNEKYQLDLIGRDYCRDRSIVKNLNLIFNFGNKKQISCYGS